MRARAWKGGLRRTIYHDPYHELQQDITNSQDGLAWLFYAKERCDSACSTSSFVMNSQLKLTDISKPPFSSDATEFSTIEKVRFCWWGQDVSNKVCFRPANNYWVKNCDLNRWSRLTMTDIPGTTSKSNGLWPCCWLAKGLQTAFNVLSSTFIEDQLKGA